MISRLRFLLLLFCFLAGFVPQAYAAACAAPCLQVKSSLSSGAGTTQADAMPVSIGSGHLLVLMANWQSVTATATVSDTVNGAWTAIGTPKRGLATGGVLDFSAQMFYVASSGTGTPTVTLTVSASVAFRSWEAFEFNKTGYSLETFAYTHQPANGLAQGVTGPITTTAASSLLVSLCPVVGGSCDTAVEPGYTLYDDGFHAGTAGYAAGWDGVGPGRYTGSWNISAGSGDTVFGLAAFSSGASLRTSDGVLYLESGSGATRDASFFEPTPTGFASVSTPSFSGLRAVDLSGAGTNAQIGPHGQIGHRGSFYFRTSALPATSTGYSIFRWTPSAILTLETSAGGVTKLGYRTAIGSAASQQGTTTLAIDTWYRISWAAGSTGTTRIFLNGNQEMSISGDTTETGYEYVGAPNGTTPGGHLYYQNFYIDDTDAGSGTPLDPGDIRVTAKLPASLNSDTYDTVLGSCAGHVTCVSERPVSATNGLENTTGGGEAQSYTLQTAATGDVDVSAQSIVGRVAWAWAAKGTGTGIPALLGSITGASAGTAGTTLAVSLTASAGNFVECVMADQVGGSTPTLADSGGNTYTALNTSTNTVRKSAWYSVVGASPGTITATFGSSSASRAIACGRFSNILATTPRDKNPTDANDSTSPYDAPSTTTLGQTNELVTGSFALAGPRNDQITTSTETGVISAGSNNGQALVTTCNDGIKSTGTSLTCAGIGGAANDLIVVVVADQKGGTAPSISDSSGANTWTALTGGTNTIRCSAWYSRIAADPGTITATVPSTNASAALAAYRFTGALATPLDKNPAMTNDSTSPYTGTISGTLAQANELLAGYFCLAGPTGDTVSASTNATGIVRGSTTGGSASTNAMAVLSYQIQAATTSVSPNITDTTARTGIAGTATFKSSGSAVTTDSIAALSYRTVSATTAIAPEVTDVIANRTGATGTASFNGLVSANPQLIENGNDNGFIVPLLASGRYIVSMPILNATSYPSNAAGIGLRSGGPEETYLYELGTLLAYKSPAGVVIRKGFSPVGTKLGSRQPRQVPKLKHRSLPRSH